MKHRLRIDATLTFESGWRIGTGREGMAGSDLGVLRDARGLSILPGTSLKGRLRTTCESLAHAFEMSACCLDRQASEVDCVSDSKYFASVSSQYQKLNAFEPRMKWLDDHVCDVCKLFGSPLSASRIRVSDGLMKGSHGQVQVRDSVVLDRDSHTAVDGLKFDYEVSQAGTQFQIQLEVQDASKKQRALLGAALIDWSEGVSVGGFTSRGLGRAAFDVDNVQHVDLTDKAQRLAWLTGRDPAKRYQQESDWQAYFISFISDLLRAEAN